MKDLALRSIASGTAASALVVWGLAAACDGGVSLAAEGTDVGVGGQGGQSTTAYLDYHEVGFAVVHTGGLRATARAEAFPKEPAFKGGKVTRGILESADGGTNAVAFAWDRSGRKLYLDLNGNRDLSDDPAGVFQSSKSFRDDYRTFTNVHLPLITAAGRRPMLFDLTLNAMRGLHCTLALRSFWEGKVRLQGKDWEVGLVLMPGGGRALALDQGNLLLRPWAERGRAFDVSSYQGSPEAFRFSPRVFFGGQAYELQCTNVTEGDNLQMQMRFTEQSPKLGEVQIAGDFVQRLTMKGKPYLVVLDRPGRSVQVPAGTYGSIKVWLKKDATEAWLKPESDVATGNHVVGGKNPARLLVGGPLTNSVAISRRGKYLSLNYQLIGLGGEYAMAGIRSEPPAFTVYHGDKKLASGRFQFG